MEISPAKLEQIIGQIDYTEDDETFYFSRNSIMIVKGNVVVEGKPEKVYITEDSITIYTSSKTKITIYPMDEGTRITAEYKKDEETVASAIILIDNHVIDPYDLKSTYQTINNMLQII